MARNYAGSVDSHSFAKAPGQRIPRSTFDRSRGVKTAFDAGYLVPVMVDELLPADTITIKESAFARLTSQVVPVLHPMYLDTFYFAVPIRLLWDNWDEFHGATEDPDDVGTEYTVPVMASEAFDAEGVLDYMGVPPGTAYGTSTPISALYPRAYNLIYKEWFRDQDITDSPVINTDDGPDTESEYPLRRRAKRHDYFTSCRPWPQKGTAVSLPLGETAPVVSEGTGIPSFTLGAVTSSLRNKTGGSNDAEFTGTLIGQNFATWNDPALEVDLTTATAATINQLREAFAHQAVFEIDARSGTRLVEHHKAHFGVHPPDYRMQRPEYLGGSSTPLQVTPVPDMASTSDNDRAQLAAYATAQLTGKTIMYSAVEHMILVCIANVRADIVYQEGVHRRFQRQDRFDYYLPSLAHLGEQAVTNNELYGKSGTPTAVFGYQERWAELRYGESTVTGKMRSDHGSSLDFWHLALDFGSTPQLNDSFILDSPPVSRVTASDPEPDMRADFYWKINHARPMPTFSVPAALGRF